MLRETPPRGLGRQNFVAFTNEALTNRLFQFYPRFRAILFYKSRGNFVSHFAREKESEGEREIVINRPSRPSRREKETRESKATTN